MTVGNCCVREEERDREYVCVREKGERERRKDIQIFSGRPDNLKEAYISKLPPIHDF
jgi:hypothetical protein